MLAFGYIEFLEKMNNFWNSKSEFYIKNPKYVEKEKSPYIIVLSRHPIDIIRMSDHDTMNSCHSERKREMVLCFG